MLADALLELYDSIEPAIAGFFIRHLDSVIMYTECRLFDTRQSPSLCTTTPEGKVTPMDI